MDRIVAIRIVDSVDDWMVTAFVSRGPNRKLALAGIVDKGDKAAVRKLVQAYEDVRKGQPLT